MASSNEWISPENVKMFNDISEIGNIHPAVGSLCGAVSNLQHVHPTSTHQKCCMVQAYDWICRAITDIYNTTKEDSGKRYTVVKLEPPTERSYRTMLQDNNEETV